MRAMTIKEKLKIHAEIEAENKRNIERWKAKKIVAEKHLLYFREGSYEEAHLLLRFLRNGTVRLGLYDSASNVETLLEGIGFKPRYGRNYNTAEFSLTRLWN